LFCLTCSKGNLKKVEELEEQLAEQVSYTYSASRSTHLRRSIANAQQCQTEAAHESGVKRADELRKKLDEFGLQNCWLHTELNRIAGVKKVHPCFQDLEGTDIHDIFSRKRRMTLKVDPELVCQFNNHRKTHLVQDLPSLLNLYS